MTVVAFLIPTIALGAEADPAVENSQRWGLLTLLPPLLAIALAFFSKNVVLSLFLGALSGTFLLSLQANIFSAFWDSFLLLVSKILNSLADPWNAGIILQVLVIGGVIALVGKMGGAKAIALSLAHKSKTPRSAQLVTFLMGIFIFFDDYANSLIVGPIMRPVTDKLRISREKLAFIVDSTAAPIAGIALISTWIGYEVGLIKDAYRSLGIEVNAYNIFVSTIPYRFYNILALTFIFFSALFLREFGPMLRAEVRARTTGKVLAADAKPMISSEATELEPKETTKLSVWNGIIPIAVLIVGAFLGFYFNGYHAIMGGDDPDLAQVLINAPLSFVSIRETFGASDASVVLFQAAVFASIVAIGMGVIKRIFTLSEAIDTWIHGMKSLLITGVILLLAWSLSSVMRELGTANYLVSKLSNTLPAFILPTIIFVLGAVISFATGTSYGTMGILMPLTIPLAHAISPVESYIIMNVGAVLTGAIFGDHCSPISDTTILSSMGSACDHIDHVKTQATYALTIAGISILFGYLLVGLGLKVYIVLPLAMGVTGLVLYLFGKPVPN
ncbi:Na+/H+ antiporter NhaC family protein [Desulfosporosinus nitroreducens]|uniref:Na+/H+ antiporter NhaC family protein n=1 Tax=Desulfosporosinus nitroreducens TaxID=2018668 RepID=A0ABT8QMV7_9FIRM|nr:Na+/H+ antiporter NhaC family protein [Desulfosporosinus nitroreducens]MDO0822575.1 Na+/H+ antiporter NhaC family protein [Desulfosporosinus nitroreducens]